MNLMKRLKCFWRKCRCNSGGQPRRPCLQHTSWTRKSMGSSLWNLQIWWSCFTSTAASLKDFRIQLAEITQVSMSFPLPGRIQFQKWGGLDYQVSLPWSFYQCHFLSVCVDIHAAAKEIAEINDLDMKKIWDILLERWLCPDVQSAEVGFSSQWSYH